MKVLKLPKSESEDLFNKENTQTSCNKTSSSGGLSVFEPYTLHEFYFFIISLLDSFSLFTGMSFPTVTRRTTRCWSP